MITDTNNQLTPAVLAALAKELGKQAKENRDALQEGSYTFDQEVTLRVNGSILVKEDSDRKSTCSIPFLAVIGVILKRAGFTRETSQEFLTQVFKDCVAADKDAREVLLAETGVKDILDGFNKNVIGALPRTSVKGSVKACATITLVEQHATEKVISEPTKLFEANNG